MRFSEAAKVGATALVALAMLAFVTFYLRGALGREGTYTQQVTFPNAQGIQEGAYVRVKGVDMGAVREVGLSPTGDALLTLRMSRRYQVKPQDSIRIVGGLFGFSPPFVEITPNGRPTAATGSDPDVLVGESATGTEEIMSRSDELLTNVNELALRMNRLASGLTRMVEDPELRRSFSRTAANFEKASASGVQVAKNMERVTGRAEGLMDSLQTTSAQATRTLRTADATLGGFRGTAAQSQKLMEETRGMVREMSGVVKSTGTVVENTGGLITDTRATLNENRDRLKTVLDRVDSSLRELQGTLTETRTFIGDPELRGDLKSTAKNIREATEGLKKITDDVRVITGDQEVQQSLKGTLGRLDDVSRQASDLFKRVEQVVGTSGNAAKSIGERLSDAELGTEITRGITSNRTRIDFDATIPWSSSTYYRVGFFDFGESNKFNIQAGQQMRPGVWTRYGIHGSKLGLGLDLGNRRRPPLALDLFGVSRPRLDMRGHLPISSSFDLTLGVNHAFRNPDPVFGLRYSR